MFFWHQSEARTAATVWNLSGKTLSPGALLAVLYFSFVPYFSARLDFPSPPLSTPGSPRMDIVTTIFKARRILRVVSHFNLSVLANETLSVSLCCEIDNFLGAVRTSFDHVLSKFSGFSWERILFLNSACVNMVMQIQVQIGDT